MISYAQNFEDVILHRVFRDRKAGFYIDVGAMDPVIDSVTKFFYDEGWCGINIEPNEHFFNRLASDRPRDINLNVAIGNREEVRTFYVSNETGLSTFDEENRDRFVKRGFRADQTTVRSTTLAEVCREHVDRPIDFLKIDCEGWEKQVLEGADWKRFHPTVVVVEATFPDTRIPAWSEWEPILTEKAQYDMVYFDGLNRFYLLRDSPGLRTHFSAPPNVHDLFKAFATEAAEQAREKMQWERDSLAARIVELEQRLKDSADENQRLSELLIAVDNEILQVRTSLEVAAETDRLELKSRAERITGLEKERRELTQALLKTRLWVGQLSQDLAAARPQRGR